MIARHHCVALLDPTGRRVLVVDGGLPRFPGRWPSPADLAATAGDLGAWVAGPPTREPDGTITNVLAGDGRTTRAGTWVPLADLADHGVSAPALAAVARSAAVWRGERVDDDGREAWFRPGWLTEVLAWVDARVDRAGPVHPEKLWSLSAVLRVPLADRDVWFKATCRGFAAEAALTAAVARLAPDVAPRVVAVDVERSWLLLEDVPGADVDDPGDGPVVAARLARLQLDVLAIPGAHDLLRASGAPDRGRDATREAVRDVLRHSVERPLLDPADLARLDALEGWLARRVDALWDAGLPDVLAHGDLHLGNAARGAGPAAGPVLFDWTDACLTHPFLDAWHLAQSAAEDAGDPAAGDGVRDAFLPAWRAARPDVDHDALWAAVEPVEAAFQLVTFEQIYRAQPAVSRWELSEMVVEGVGRLLALMDADPAVTRPTA